VARGRTLRQLAAALRGQPPPVRDWTAVLDLANRSLVTPQLAAALQPVADHVPAQIRGFLDEVLRRNRERNRRLLGQLEDAAAALGAAGIVPVLLKGAAGLLAPHPPDRMLSDLDLLVAPAQAPAAVAALEQAGFSVLARYPGAAVHVVAELGRPQDVGLIDLHQRPPGPPGVAESADLAARRHTVDTAGGAVQVPDPASQILYLVLHDQFHDGDYWRGGFDLRHLSDLARLAPALSGDDWRWLRAACGSSLVRGALEAQLLSAQRLLAAQVLPAPPSAHAHWTHRRWALQYAHPSLRLPLAALAVVTEWPQVLAHRAADRAGRRRVLGPAAVAPTARLGERLDRLRGILTVDTGKT
jgi:hypothetical protein